MQWITLPRIAGIIVLAISLLFVPSSYLFGFVGIGALFVIFSDKNVTRRRMDALLSVDVKTLVLTVFFDIVAVTLFILIAYLGSSIHKQFVGESYYEPLDLSNQALSSLAGAQAQWALVKNFVAYTIIIAIIMLVLIILVNAFTRMLVWQSLVQKQSFRKHLLMALAWWACFIPIVVPFIWAYMSRSQIEILYAMFFIILPPYLYLTPIAYTSFSRTGKIGNAICTAINEGIIGKTAFLAHGILRFVVPYTYLIVIYYVLSQLVALAKLGNAGNLVFALVFIGFARSYITKLLIEEKICYEH